jgi:hypothetical protein
MLTDWDIYCAFRKAQANFLNRPYRLPKNWEKFKTRMKKTNLDALELATRYFNTKWNKLDPERYFSTGFYLHGNGFTYIRFFDKKNLIKYIKDDKMLKRDLEVNKRSLIESAKFIKQYMSNRNGVNPKISLLRQYSCLKEGNMLLPVLHYIQGHVDTYFLVWLMRRGLVVIDDDHRPQIPYIVERYREHMAVINKPQISKFLERMREYIG